MKLKIKRQRDTFGFYYWEVEFNGVTVPFHSHAAAINHANKIWKRYYKEQAAFSMLRAISVNDLCIKDSEFVIKLKRLDAKDITKNQYGYLKGIYERQAREF